MKTLRKIKILAALAAAASAVTAAAVAALRTKQAMGLQDLEEDLLLEAAMPGGERTVKGFAAIRRYTEDEVDAAAGKLFRMGYIGLDTDRPWADFMITKRGRRALALRGLMFRDD